MWSRSAQELFYVALSGAIMRVGVEPGGSWRATPPAVMVKEGFPTAVNTARNYDVLPDGQRFLLLKAASELAAPPPQLVVVQHFDEELKRLAAPR